MTDTATMPTSSDALSPAEMAYFSSGGTDTAGLEQEYGGSLDLGEQATPTPTPDTSAPSADAAADKDPDADPDEDEDVIVGEDGKPRDKNSGKFVPHAALHKERVRRRELEGEISTYREKMARADERLAILNELIKGNDPAALAQAAPEAAQNGKPAPKSALEEDPIDPEQDIFAAFRQVQRQNAELVKAMREGSEQQKQQEAVQSVKSAYQADAESFMGSNPDFKDAYGYLINSLHAELEFMGVNDMGERNKLIAQKEREFVEQAFSAKKRPAEAMYQFAKVRGWSPTAARPATEQSKNTPSNGQATSQSRIDTVKRGQNAVLSLSSAGGASGEVLTPEVLANMSEHEFAALAKKLGNRGMRRILGG